MPGVMCVSMGRHSHIATLTHKAEQATSKRWVRRQQKEGTRIKGVAGDRSLGTSIPMKVRFAQEVHLITWLNTRVRVWFVSSTGSQHLDSKPVEGAMTTEDVVECWK